MPELDDEVLGLIKAMTSGSRERNPTLKPFQRKEVNGHYSWGDKDEVLQVVCVSCRKRLLRPRWVIERLTSRLGFVPCSNQCREKQLRQKERILVPYRKAS